MILKSVKKMCEKKGITTYKLEKECGFSNGCICKWEKSIPSVDKIAKVAAVLGCTIDELLNETEEG